MLGAREDAGGLNMENRVRGQQTVWDMGVRTHTLYNGGLDVRHGVEGPGRW